jgi:N-acetylglucosamine repressor
VRKINTRNFTRATRTTPRQVNRMIVLNLVREHQPISRAELARRIGIGRGMVTALVNELLAEALIYEGEVGHAARGRKPKLLYVRTRDRLVVAVDTRFTQTYVMLSDFSGRKLALEMFQTPYSPERFVDELVQRIHGLLDGQGAEGECEGIGLAIPGMIEHRTGRILNVPTLRWRDVDLRGRLQSRLHLPVHIERDAVACALAQMWLTPPGAHGADNFVYVTVSDGIGTGLVVNGEVVRGHGDTAGEFGHMGISQGGPFCLCGSQGCWEAYASNPATVARYLGRPLEDRESYERLREGGFTIVELIARARAADPAALAALRETGRYLGEGFGSLINALNPGRIIVGGELTAAWELVSGPIAEAVARRTLTAAAAATPITPEPAEAYPRLRGATALVVAPLFAMPRVA